MVWWRDRTIHTDQGREFESRLFQHLCEALGADKTRTTPYHPQSDGMMERQNRTIQQMLSAYVNEKRDDWGDHLDLIMMAYRSSVHSVHSELDYVWEGGQLPLDC